MAAAAKGEMGSWVSDAAREKFMAAYERVLALWPQPVEALDLETTAAATRVNAYRPRRDGAPVVLLTGAGGSSPLWQPHVAALSAAGPVYAIDFPGDPGASVPRTLMTPPDTCAGWLDEVLAQLGGQPAHLVGTSFGGWVAMNQALRSPGRVASITLLDPAGLTALDARFWWWLSVSGMASLSPRPVRRRLARWLDNPAMLDQAMMDLMWAGIRSYRMERKFPALLTDDQLAAITVPALLVTGARSALITPVQARDRASHLPNAQVAIVPGSHGGFNRIDALNAQVVAFLQSVGATAA